jgi:transcriptional regulator with XRE-family HTH domain
MTSTELKENLKELGWSQAELSRRIKVTQTAVSRWVNGAKVPGMVAFGVELALEIKRIGRMI